MKKLRDPRRKKLLEWRKDNPVARREYDKADDWIRPLHLRMDDEREVPPANFHLPLPERRQRKAERRWKNGVAGRFYVKGPWRFDMFVERTLASDEELVEILRKSKARIADERFLSRFKREAERERELNKNLNTLAFLASRPRR